MVPFYPQYICCIVPKYFSGKFQVEEEKRHRLYSISWFSTYLAFTRKFGRQFQDCYGSGHFTCRHKLRWNFINFKVRPGPTTVGQKIKKKSRSKKLVKSNNSISRKNFFDQFAFFAISKMAKYQFLNWEKVKNCQKCNFTKKNFD